MLIHNRFLTNTPIGQKHPRGTPWKYILWTEKRKRTRRGFGAVKDILGLTGKTKAEINEQLRRLIEKRGVSLCQKGCPQCIILDKWSKLNGKMRKVLGRVKRREQANSVPRVELGKVIWA